MDIVDQVVLRYDTANRAFRPVASTLAPDDQLASSPRFIALADAAYRSQDAQREPSLCFTRAPDDPQGRGMIIYRVPDVGSPRLAAAAHVLIGRELNAGTALALSVGWPHWTFAGASQPFGRLGWTGLKNDAQQRNLELEARARAPELEVELTRLVDALLRVGTGRLAVINHRSDPALLLAGARGILRDFVSDDWTFSTGEPAQKAGIRITFMLPDGSVTSDAHVDLSADGEWSSGAISVAILVRAFMNSMDSRSWSKQRTDLRINDIDSLLAWASQGAPSFEAALQAEREAHADTSRQWDAQRRDWKVQVAEQAAERQRLTDQVQEAHREREAADEVATDLQGKLFAREQQVDVLQHEISRLRSANAALRRHLEYPPGWEGDPSQVDDVDVEGDTDVEGDVEGEEGSPVSGSGVPEPAQPRVPSARRNLQLIAVLIVALIGVLGVAVATDVLW